jgi:hypothetical protein
MVLADEYVLLAPDLSQVKPGDVVAFYTPPHQQNVMHTAQIINCQGDPKTLQNIQVWTKNGCQPEKAGSLQSVIDVYGGAYNFWRKQP